MADSDYDLILNFGQSNAQGYVATPSTIPDLTALSAGDVRDWDGSTLEDIVVAPVQTTDNTSVISQGIVGGQQQQYEQSGTNLDNSNGGYGNQFCLDWIANYAGKKILWVHYAPSNSGIVSGQSYGGGNWTDTHLARAITKSEQAMDAATAAGYNWKLRAVLWCQGEADTGKLEDGSITQADYEAALGNIIDTLWSRWGTSGAYGNVYDDRSGNGKFFGMFPITSKDLSGSDDATTPDFYSWELIRKAQHNVVAARSDAVVLCPAVKFFGRSGRCWEPAGGVHWAQEAHNEAATDAVNVLIDGYATHFPAITAPSGLSLTSVNALTAYVAFTPGDATAFQQVVRIKKSTESDYRLLKAISSTATTVRISDNFEPGATYNVQIGSEPIDGGIVQWSAALDVAIPAMTVSDSDISAFTTAAGTVSATAELHIKQQLAALTSAGIGIGQGLKHLYVCRTDYNANSGSTLYDVLQVGNLTVNGTMTRGATAYSIAASTAAYFSANSVAGFPQGGSYTIAVNGKWPVPAANNAGLWSFNVNSASPDHAYFNTGSLSLAWQIGYSFPLRKNVYLPLSYTLPTSTRNTVAGVYRHEFTPGSLDCYRLFAGGSSTDRVTDIIRAPYQAHDESGQQIGRRQGSGWGLQGDYSVIAIYDRDLSGTEYVALDAVMTDLATGTAASEGGATIKYGVDTGVDGYVGQQVGSQVGA